MKQQHRVWLSLSPSASDFNKFTSKPRKRAEPQQKLQQTAHLRAIHAEAKLRGDALS